jgi:hypothetical protein
VKATRNAGALIRRGSIARLVGVLLLAMAGGIATADELQLQDVKAAVVRTRPPAAGNPTLVTDGDGPLRLELDTSEGHVVFELEPHHALGAFGSSGRAEAYTGALAGRPGSWASLTRTPAGWSGIWFDGEEFRGIEPAARLAGARHRAVASAPPGQPMVFRLRDVVWDDATFEGDVVHAPAGEAQTLQALADGIGPVTLAAIDGPTHELTVDVVVDSYLVRREGEDLDGYLLAQLNIIDGLYRNQLGLQVVAKRTVKYTSAGTDYFTSTDVPEDLLDELSRWRLDQPRQQQASLTHLFTGRDLDRRTVGLAFLDSLCSRRYSASLSEARTAPTFAALIAAHEIAHVLGAPHDGDEQGACAHVSGAYLMSPRINGSQQFSSCSIAQMMPTIEEAPASCLVRVAGATGGGGGALAGTALALLGLMTLHRARRRVLQMRANQSAR